jgi:hypothetical protein
VAKALADNARKAKQITTAATTNTCPAPNLTTNPSTLMRAGVFLQGSTQGRYYSKVITQRLIR